MLPTINRFSILYFMFVFWKAKPVAWVNVSRAFRYGPDFKGKSGAATAIPFSYTGSCCYFGLHWPPLAVHKPDRTKSPERSMSEDLTG
ncbi:hypothetical protein CA265_19765 [Sphingobacteriaceae bacterium GW460-11-11-14-LB5]|nr:hypothetical protein CA265_19765 [Sphingobacteriaceae bacterium GW460-11-11-14-LB5]